MLIKSTWVLCYSLIMAIDVIGMGLSEYNELTEKLTQKAETLVKE